MRITVDQTPRIRGSSQLDVPEAATAETVLRTLELHPDAVLVVRDGTPIPIDAPVADGDRLKVVHVASGG